MLFSSGCAGTTPPTKLSLNRPHDYIVKGGEDLRLDARLQLLLELCGALAAGTPGAERLQVGHALEVWGLGLGFRV